MKLHSRAFLLFRQVHLIEKSVAETLSDQSDVFSYGVVIILCIFSLINSVVFAWYLCILTGLVVISFKQVVEII